MILFALLLAGVEPAAAVPSPTAPPAPAKVKCKSQPVTGSLAQTVKECHTPAEWDALRRRTQDDARRVLNSAASGRSQ